MAALLDLWTGLTGVVQGYAGATAPNGWLLCYGQAINRTTYAELFAVIGTTYGAGNGTTTFALPDLRGRVIAGVDNMGGTAVNRLTSSGTGNPGVNGAVLGATGGVDRHTLSIAQMPAHTHNYESLSQTSLAGTGSGAVFSNKSLASASAGLGQAHPNVQPTLVLNYIIKI